MRTMIATALALGACGHAAPSPARPGATGCQPLLRHLVAIHALEPQRMPDPDAALLVRDPEQFYAERCSDQDYLAYLDHMPPASRRCLEDATNSAQSDACFAAMPPDPEPVAIKCPAFTGATAGESGIAGVIVDDHGQPVVGATVVVSGGAETSPMITADDGAYAFTLAPGTYAVEVYAGASHEVRPCTAANGGAVTRLDVAIAPD